MRRRAAGIFFGQSQETVMEQLSGQDAMFLYGEMDNTPMHIGPVLILSLIHISEPTRPY